LASVVKVISAELVAHDGAVAHLAYVDGFAAPGVDERGRVAEQALQADVFRLSGFAFGADEEAAHGREGEAADERRVAGESGKYADFAVVALKERFVHHAEVHAQELVHAVRVVGEGVRVALVLLQHGDHAFERFVAQTEARGLNGVVGPHVSVGKGAMLPRAECARVVRRVDAGRAVGPDDLAGHVFVVVGLRDRRLMRQVVRRVSGERREFVQDGLPRGTQIGVEAERGAGLDGRGV